MSCEDLKTIGISKIECSMTESEKESFDSAIRSIELQFDISRESAENIIKCLTNGVAKSVEAIKKFSEVIKELAIVPTNNFDFKIASSKNSVNPYDRKYKGKRRW